MKKIISIFLVFMISFSAFTIHKQKQANAIAIAGGYLGISAILKILAGGALLAGTGFVVGDLVHKPEDNTGFTDFLKDVYKASFELEPQQQPPPPEPLDTMDQTALLSLLTKQGIEVGSDLYQYIKDYYNEEDTENNIPDPSEIDGSFNATYDGFDYSFALPSKLDGYASGNSYYNIFKSAYADKTFTVPFHSNNPHPLAGKKVFVEFSSERIIIGTTFPKVYDTVKIISTDNSYVIVPSYPLLTIKPDGSLYNGTTPLNKFLTFGDDYIPPEKNIPDVITPPLEPLPDVMDWENKFQQFDLSPLNGLVSNAQEMVDIVTGAKQVPPQEYEKIMEGWNQVLKNYLSNPNFQGLPDEESIPETDPTTGALVFGDIPDGPILDPETMPDDLTALERIIYWLKGIWYAILDIPTGIINGLNKLYNLLSTWLNQFWTKIQEIIDDFWMSFSDWWQDNFIYHWTTFQNWIQNIWQGIPDLLNNIWEWLQGLPVLDISNLLNNMWEWLQGLPDLIYSWFIPEPELIQDTWQPVIDLWNNKLDPVLAPFQNLAFYEEELQDVSVNLKFGSYQGTHKIIDYQYVKSVKNSVKSIIRAFFWILIIFFNLDQVHRLIRNQSIINAYVRKIEPPKGRD